MKRAPFGLPRAQRLRRSADFIAIRRGGIKSRDSFFSVSARRCDGEGRIGTVVGRRVSPKAVARNRIKRQIRESFRLHQAMLQGLQIVVVAQPPTAAAERGALARALKAHWQRLIS